MQESTSLVSLGVGVWLITVALASATGVYQQYTGDHLGGPLESVLAGVVVFGHILVPIPGLAILRCGLSVIGISGAPASIGILAVPCGFITAGSSILIGFQLGEAVADLLGVNSQIQTAGPTD
jgi:hypothetical protein